MKVYESSNTQFKWSVNEYVYYYIYVSKNISFSKYQARGPKKFTFSIFPKGLGMFEKLKMPDADGKCPCL